MASPAPNPRQELIAETPDARQARMSWERARIAEADADFAAGRFIEGEELKAWLAQDLAEAQAAMDRSTL